MRQRNIFFRLVPLFFALMATFGSQFVLAETSDLQRVQKAIKNLPVEDSSGKIQPVLQGSKIYIFWASWCGVCKKNFPYWLYAIEQGTLPKETFFLNTDTDRNKWLADTKKLGLTAHNYRISDETRKAIMPISKLPMAYIINNQNEVESVYHIWNERSTSLLAKRYRWMLRGQQK